MLLVVALLLLGPLAVATPTEPVVVDVVSATHAIRGDAEVSADLVAKSHHPDTTSRVPLRVPGSAEIDLAPGVAFRLSLEGPVWAPPVEIPAEGREDGSRTMFASEVGWLSGRLRNATGQPLDAWPDEVHVRFDLLRNPILRMVERSSWRFETDCPVTDEPPGERTFRCRLPEGVSDVRLMADGFVPMYLWSVKVRPGGVEDGAVFRLETGASLVGTVQRADGSPAVGSEVALVAPVAGGVARGRRLRMRRGPPRSTSCRRASTSCSSPTRTASGGSRTGSSFPERRRWPRSGSGRSRSSVP